MALTTNTKIWKILIVIFVLMTIIFTTLFFFKTIFITFVIGICLIFLTEKLILDYKKRMKKYNIYGMRAKLLGYAFLFFWFFVIILTVGTSLKDLGEVIEEFSGSDQTISNSYGENVKPLIPDMIEKVILTDNMVKRTETFVIATLSGFLSDISFIVLNGILIIPIMFYMYYKRKDTLIFQTLKLIPRKFYRGFSRGVEEIGEQLHDFFYAKIIESIVIGSICCFGFYIAGLKGWLVLGVLAGFLNIVPYIGPFIGAIPPILIGFIDDPIISLYVLITVVIAQLVDNLYLIPFMISFKVKMDPLLGIVIILVSAKLFGLMGMVFGIPMFIIYKIILVIFYQELVIIYEEKKEKHPRGKRYKG